MLFFLYSYFSMQHITFHKHNWIGFIFVHWNDYQKKIPLHFLKCRKEQLVYMSFYEKYFDMELYDVPYQSSEEHILELLSLLDIHLHILLLLQEEHEKGSDSFRLRGMVITHDEVTNALHASFQSDLYLLSDIILNDILEAKEHIESRISFTPSTTILSFLALTSYLNLSSFEEFCLLLGIACDYNRKYEKLFGYLQNDITMKFPTFGFAIALYQFYIQENISISELYHSFSNAFQFCFSSPISQTDLNTSLMQPIRFKKIIIDFLLETPLLSYYQTYLQFFSCNAAVETRFIRHDTFTQLKDCISYLLLHKHNSFSLLHLYGSTGIGKHFLLKELSVYFSIPILFINTSILYTTYIEKKADFFSFIEEILLFTLLKQSWIVLIDNLEYKDSSNDSSRKEQEILFLFLLQLKQYASFCFLITDQKNNHSIITHDISWIEFYLPSLSAKEHIILWKEFSKPYSISNEINLITIANQYLLTPNEIKIILETSLLFASSYKRTYITKQDILSAIKQMYQNQLGSYAKQLTLTFTWNDLILKDSAKRQLQLICAHVNYRSLVGDTWGFYKKMPYGRGICSLFYGSPGTGKTMAVQVIANQLGLDLYRIDLSQIISKYIGETEKHITYVFEKASSLNAILFFDEADSIFAKRSDINDANDRNANAETAHLLQKIEEYNGICILATNFLNNIDDAFKRRIKFIIPFDFPDETIRFQLWKSLLPDTANCIEPIDFSYFSKNFELSGSNIKEILLNAAFIAASEHSGIANKHIVEALILNQSKYGKILNITEFEHLY